MSATDALRTLREWRARRSISQGELATRVGVSQTTISSIEQGKVAPTLFVARRIARALNVHIDDVDWKDTGDMTEE